MKNRLISMRWNNHTLTFVRMLECLRVKKLYCDVTLICEGKHYPVHKFVLTACSKYFEEVFNQSQCKHPFIFLKDISCSEIEALLNYMYKGEANLSHESLSSFIKASESLKIRGLAVPDEESLDDSNCVISPNSSDCIDISKKEVSMGEFVNLENGEIKLEPDSGIPLISVKSEDDENEFNLPEECLQSLVEEDDENEFNPPEECLQSLVEEDIAVNIEQLELPQILEHPESVTLDTLTNDCEADKDVKYIAESNLTEFQKCETIDTDSVESGKKKHLCPYCQKKFRDKTAQEIHVRRIHTLEKPYACSVCSYRTAVKSVLKEHYQKHTGEKPFACPYCSVKMTANWKLKHHIDTKHLKITPSKKRSGKGAEKVKSAKCDLCSYVSVSRSKLKLHVMRIHTKEKPFHCKLNQCNYATTTNSQLNKHMLSHTGEKPFSCMFCPLKYAHKANLLRHMAAEHV